MTTGAFLTFVAEVRGFDGETRARRVGVAVDRCGLGAVLAQPIDTLSKGFRRRVGLAQAIVHEPDALILDEPTDGLDPNQKRQVRALIRELADTTAIIVSTHILEEVDAVCSRAVIVDAGRVVLDDTPQNLVARAADFGAMTVVTDAALAQQACAELAALAEVRGVNARIGRDGAVRLDITPPAGVDATPAVAGLFRAKGWPINAMHTNTGSLDAVFQAVTDSGDTDSGDAVGGGAGDA
jgi:ABC-2 type transport system ATP-binding protein